MAKIFNLPAVGDTMVEGEIVTWYVSVGDEVDLDQLICEIATDKSVVEMSTPHRGTVLQLGADAGGVVAVGSPLIVVGEPGEQPPEVVGPTQEAQTVQHETQSTPKAALRQPVSSATPAPPNDGPNRVPVVSPLLRRFAHEEGVDLRSVAGTGPNGRITRADIAVAIGEVPAVLAQLAVPERVRAMPKVRKAAREHGIDLAHIVGTGANGAVIMDDLPAIAPARGERVRLSPMRRAIARNLTAAAEVPQFTSMMDFDATRLLERRTALQQRVDGPVPVDTLLMADLTTVLQEHRLMNAQLVGDEVEYFDAFDIGLAVDTPDGLMVPVVRSADQLDHQALASEIVRLATSARERKIMPDELTGGTCTVNNVGALGILQGTPILPLGTSTIVAFGATRSVVQIREGQPVQVPMATLSATFDHRLIDGGDSARFLQALRAQLET